MSHQEYDIFTLEDILDHIPRDRLEAFLAEIPSWYDYAKSSRRGGSWKAGMRFIDDGSSGCIGEVES